MDVVITALIVGVLAAVVVPRFVGSLHQYRVDAAATRIQADLELARESAISLSKSVVVQFTPDSDEYSMPQLTDPDHPGSAYTVRLSASPYETSLVSAMFGGDAEVEFDHFGRPDSGGTITIQSGDRQRVLTIDTEVGQAMGL